MKQRAVKISGRNQDKRFLYLPVIASSARFKTSCCTYGMWETGCKETRLGGMWVERALEKRRDGMYCM